MQVRSGFGTAFVALMAFSIAGFAGAEDKKVDLKVGDEAPKFESLDDTGKEWKSTDHVGKKVVVVYFYPADFTGGCTKQACSYRDDMGKLKDLGVEVVGVSGDSVKNHELFKLDHKLNFTLLADEKGEVAKAFGVPVAVEVKTTNGKKGDGSAISLQRPATSQRWTFVIGKDGKIALKNPKANATEDSKAVIKLLAEKPSDKKE
ncbi:MAG: alkyl hydroperoxide reductase/Thiol specific antioxidant/Mal allergen [Planctomycetaceae bacterium]|nr:alkyl hydroperoxide reductase/Thiol specific antioxidant/Mal allergen [Planctomycetaceae bacterium]